MKTEVPSTPPARVNVHPKRRRTKPKFRMIRSPRGRIQKLFINGRIERVNLGHDIDPETCAFLPILNQIVVISNVEPGVCCYAKPLTKDERGYKILTFPEHEAMDSDFNLTQNAVKGLTFNECALNCADVRERYLQNLRVRKMNIGDDNRKIAPKLFVRYGEREV